MCMTLINLMNMTKSLYDLKKKKKPTLKFLPFMSKEEFQIRICKNQKEKTQNYLIKNKKIFHLFKDHQTCVTSTSLPAL
jgi:hypothetical protein